MAANNAESAESQTHIFGVKCKNGHITYYDKRNVCTDGTDVTRTVLPDGRKINVVLLRCEHCPAQTECEIDCGAYL